MTDLQLLEPIINGMHGFYFYGSTDPDVPSVSGVIETKNRMSIKSQNFVGNYLSPSFYRFVDDEQYEAHCRGCTEANGAYQDVMAMCMGL